MIIPEGGRYLWDWYFQINNGLRRVERGVCNPIPWSEFAAWARVTATEIRAAEYSILSAMDVAFCSEMNKELAAFHERSRAAMQADIDKARRSK